jgi:protein-tyrosine phosphatase
VTPSPSTLLFLCTGNYYRSRYAELLFNASKPATLNWHAISRGFDPSPFNPGPIAVASLERLAARGYATPAEVPYPRRLTEADLTDARRIIALDAHEHPPYVREWFPSWERKIEYWHVPDLDRMGAPEALSRIEFNIERLIQTLSAPFGARADPDGQL